MGPNLRRFRLGDQVLGVLAGCGWGAFAEYARATEEALVPTPSGLTDEQAAAAPQAGPLAWGRGPASPSAGGWASSSP